MGYNDFRPSQNRNDYGSNSNRGNAVSGYNGYNNNRGGKPFKKHSGARLHGVTKTGEVKQFITGWNYSKRNGMRKFIAGPYKGTKEHKSSTGKIWENWVVKMTLSDGTNHLTSGLFDKHSQKLIISDLGFVLNPRAKNGGYCGTFTKRD